MDQCVEHPHPPGITQQLEQAGDIAGRIDVDASGASRCDAFGVDHTGQATVVAGSGELRLLVVSTVICTTVPTT